MSNNKITPWYKEPWAYLIFALPLSAVIAGITTLFIALDEPDPLVVGDYYKKGKAINTELAKVKQAQKLGMRFKLSFYNNELIIIPTGIEKEFPVLNVNFYHSTLEKRDFYVALTADANGHFRQFIDNDINGKWQVTISSFEQSWKIQNTIALPQKNYIDIEPNIKQSN